MSGREKSMGCRGTRQPEHQRDGLTGWLGSDIPSPGKEKGGGGGRIAPTSIKPSLWAACDGGGENEDHSVGTGWGRGEMLGGSKGSSKLGVLVEQETAPGSCGVPAPPGHPSSILQRRKAAGGSQPPTPAPADSHSIFPSLKQRPEKSPGLPQGPSPEAKDFTPRVRGTDGGGGTGRGGPRR